MDDAILKNLGPLAPLAGSWEGDKGQDLAPSASRGLAESLYRERITFTPFGPVDNHEQSLWGLRTSTVAWRIGSPDSFHEETGYFMWDAAARQAFRCFMVPRGITVIAGGAVEPDARTIALTAELGSPTFGICSAPFLDREFRTERYTLTITVHDDGSFSYEGYTFMRMPGRAELFDHLDRNRLTRVD
ncbi:MAG: heme-binding beta-barrel domain-containing protein [Myxococcota bacterium]